MTGMPSFKFYNKEFIDKMQFLHKLQISINEHFEYLSEMIQYSF